MAKITPFQTKQQWFLACSLVLATFFLMNKITFQKQVAIDLGELPEHHMVMEGYVVSKHLHSIWLSEEPGGFKEIVFGPFQGHGANQIKVSKNKNYKNAINFRQLKLNQKVRVYCDYVRESNPPKTEAYYIEILDHKE
ncbi:DUF3221 domain-containing protein [Sporosarcina cyprini]|uniref:DUF3221 domain-containing protein n=1 Tax=Sporosarcina cyprini TaxID=2910523 RepID=UPI001EDDED67|nr:DUF3221 domain-containing protein [Sporosarcina cyprini]MCG3089286.1 YobA family protein [Sporosarcina cyprini]